MQPTKNNVFWHKLMSAGLIKNVGEQYENNENDTHYTAKKMQGTQ